MRDKRGLEFKNSVKNVFFVYSQILSRQRLENVRPLSKVNVEKGGDDDGRRRRIANPVEVLEVDVLVKDRVLHQDVVGAEKHHKGKGGQEDKQLKDGI